MSELFAGVGTGGWLVVSVMFLFHLLHAHVQYKRLECLIRRSKEGE